MRLVDVHCHLESDEFADGPASVVQAAKEAGIVKLITASIVPAQWPRSLELAAQFPEVECALGIHPWYIKPDHEQSLKQLAAARDRGAVAIGEIGLDRRVDHPSLDIQLKFFEVQLDLARQLDLPVIIHCRAAFNELIEVLKRSGAPKAGGILHNFSGSIQLADELRKFGLVFSFGGVLTYRNSRKKRDLLQKIYPSALVLETDSPDIPPVEAPGRPNVPANIVYNLRAAAEILGKTDDEVAETTTKVALSILNLNA